MLNQQKIKKTNKSIYDTFTKAGYHFGKEL